MKSAKYYLASPAVCAVICWVTLILSQGWKTFGFNHTRDEHLLMSKSEGDPNFGHENYVTEVTKPIFQVGLGQLCGGNEFSHFEYGIQELRIKLHRSPTGMINLYLKQYIEVELNFY